MLSGVWRRLPSWAVDALLAAVFMSVNTWEVLHLTDDGYRAGGTSYNLVVLNLFASLLVIRRRRPVLCWVFVHGLFVATVLVSPHSGFFFGTLLPACVATYTVARYGPRRWARWVWLSGPVIYTAIAVGDRVSEDPVGSLLSFSTMSLCAWGAGRVLGRLADRDEELRVATDRLVAEQEARRRVAISEERSRIALGMHDVVSVAVAVMVVRLGEEIRALTTEEADVSRLESAEQAGRQALVELRRTVGMLRPSDGTDDLASLTQVPALLARFQEVGRDVGLDVTWETTRTEELGHVPDAVGLAAYRILQEALTNALKYGGHGPVRVAIDLRAGDVVVRVRNRLPPTSSGPLQPSGRNGLVGMRERVATFGGSLRAGVVDDFFEVSAVLPWREEVSV